jgi:hypothetical protein
MVEIAELMWWRLLAMWFMGSYIFCVAWIIPRLLSSAYMPNLLSRNASIGFGS